MPSYINTLKNIFSMLKSQKLIRFQGKDVNELQTMIENYYSTASGDGYFETLSNADIWKDMINRRNFSSILEKSDHILDFGCGAGNLAFYISQNNPEKKVYANDIGNNSGKFLTGTSVQFIKNNVYQTDFATGSMDMVISRFVIEHTAYPEKLLTEALRLLKPGGYLYLLYPQIIFRANIITILIELFSWVFNPSKVLYLVPQINDKTAQADDRDSLWLTNPVKMKNIFKKVGFEVVANVPTQSLIIGRKPL